MLSSNYTARAFGPKTVVVHRGARDAYQVSAALADAGMLDSLVTDLYWPADGFASRLARVLPSRFASQLRARYSDHLPSAFVQQTLLSGLISFALDKIPVAPFSWRQQATRWTDRTIGRRAGMLAAARGASLLSYSYYGYDAFASYGRPGILFQLHPHPASVRKILQRELEEHPECSGSLKKEWELTLPEDDFDRLIAETCVALPRRFLIHSANTHRKRDRSGCCDGRPIWC